MAYSLKSQGPAPDTAIDLSDSFLRDFVSIHTQLLEALGGHRRIRLSIALYDPDIDALHTYAMLGPGAADLTHYTAKLSDVPSLAFAKDGGGCRVIDDLTVFQSRVSPHNAAIMNMGYRASYARAVEAGGILIGIVFVNAVEPGFFTADRRHAIDPFLHLAEMLLKLRTMEQRSMDAALVSAQEVGAYRDTDTARHLSRMAHFARLIGEGVAEKYGLGETFLDRVFRFAPIHDIGKVGIADAILLKPGKLTAEEFAAMKTHASIGVEMVRKIVARLGLSEMPGREILENIVEFHHERRDGSGYPRGLKGDGIPIEAQIVSVADVFDALTSRRPYKEPWPVDRAIDELKRMSQGQLNEDCVAALVAALPEAARIVERFAE